jgi:dihydrofolate reductase
MKISLIAAADEENGIGLNGLLPWRLPDDLKRFKQLTLGHHLIMGRKTYQSIGKPLPGRTTIVVTRQSEYQPEGVLTAPGVKAALELARSRGESEAFVCGGGEIYHQMLPLAERVCLTRVHARLAADVRFPELAATDWQLIESIAHPADERHPYPFTFLTYQKG